MFRSTQLPDKKLFKDTAPLGQMVLGKLGKLGKLGNLGPYAMQGRLGVRELESLVELFRLGKAGKLTDQNLETFQIGVVGSPTKARFGELGAKAKAGVCGFDELKAIKRLNKLFKTNKASKKISNTLAFTPTDITDNGAMDLGTKFPKIDTTLLKDYYLPALGDINQFGQLSTLVLEGKFGYPELEDLSKLATSKADAAKVGSIPMKDLGQLQSYIKQGKLTGTCLIDHCAVGSSLIASCL